MSRHDWNSHSIEVKSIAHARYLWLAVSLYVFVDGEQVGFSSNKLEGLRTKVPFSINGTHGVVTSRANSAHHRIRYTIEMDGKCIGEGSTYAANWYKAYLSYAAWGVVLGLLLLGVAIRLGVFPMP
ncbi:hypothetical protein [Roseimaritima ulvae]|uniref:Uncharacterized protein n=1 Tax=Roseimaritima ulvae TaxID=980254 RepID=A0A5B9QJ89_9BACT|nr:hypothetical protein [Roseimaritima ulvae]QEG38964.1 hypothetical protein UC8_09250 [Roseimaritima ulvae]